MLEQARERRAWLVLAGHEIGEDGPQTTSVAALHALLTYANDPANGVWVAPVGEVVAYIEERRNPARGEKGRTWKCH